MFLRLKSIHPHEQYYTQSIRFRHVTFVTKIEQPGAKNQAGLPFMAALLGIDGNVLVILLKCFQKFDHFVGEQLRRSQHGAVLLAEQGHDLTIGQVRP